MKIIFNTLPVKKYLAERGFSQRWLAVRITTSTGYMSQLFSNERNPSPKMCQRILAGLKGFEFNDLFTVKDEGTNRRHERASRRPRKVRHT